MSATAPERADWSGEGVRIAEVVARLGRLQGEHGRHDHRHASARTLNLVVVPGAATESDVGRRLAELGAHSPSRTILLGEHAADRVDAELTMECAAITHGVGLCHDRVLLRADQRRLGHADALVGPLLMAGVPTVVWLPGSTTSPAEAALAPLADHVVLDSAAPGRGSVYDRLARAARTANVVEVHDLAWLRLAWWRARIAAAFDSPHRRVLVARLDRLEIRHEPDALAAALLLAGWVAARASWRIESLADHGDRHLGRAPGVELALVAEPGVAGWGGIERVALCAGAQEVSLERAGASEAGRDVLAEAFNPLEAGVAGYEAALAAVLGPLERAG